jgi:hypothetical protein
MQVIESAYVVTLRDYPEEIPAKERIAAETRYAQALEKQLGGPEQVAARGGVAWRSHVAQGLGQGQCGGQAGGVPGSGRRGWGVL